MSFNIALLSNERRRDIELDKAAALLANNLKLGKVSRHEAKEIIDQTDESRREYFRQALNKYRGMK